MTPKQKVYRHREHLTGEHTAGDAGQLALACLFIVVWVSDTFFFESTTFLNQYIPLYIRIPLSIVIFLIAGYLAKTGLSIVFSDDHTDVGVIRNSVFSAVRHPIYLGEILLYAGFLMLSLSLAAAFVWVIVIVFLHYISRFEEMLLLDRFGDDYRMYMQETPMWIPKLRRK